RPRGAPRPGGELRLDLVGGHADRGPRPGLGRRAVAARPSSARHGLDDGERPAGGRRRPPGRNRRAYRWSVAALFVGTEDGFHELGADDSRTTHVAGHDVTAI